MKSLLFIIICISLSACVRNPVTGSNQISILSVEDEIKIGSEQAEKIEQAMGVVDNKNLVDYVRSVGKRISRYSTQQYSYHFNVVNSDIPNAFALPGGYVYVSRGMLQLANSEDELAGVIGHEIGHVAARHAATRITRSAPLGLITGITALATGIVSSDLADAVSNTGTAINSALLAPYNRQQENDADEIGQSLAIQAGWNPLGISEYLDNLHRLDELHNRPQGIAFLSTHPSTPARIEETRRRAKAISKPNAKYNSLQKHAFLNRLEGLKVGEDADLGVFHEQVFLHPEMQFAVNFPKNWQYENYPQGVVGVSKNKGSAVLLETSGKGKDPVAAAMLYLKQKNVENVKIQKLSVNGLPASRVDILNAGKSFILTWIVLDDTIFRLTGFSNNSSTSARAILFNFASSFHRMTAKERTSIKQQRLHIVRAKQGETLVDIVTHSQSVWDVAMCSMVNNLSPNQRLDQGHPVKIVIATPI